MLDLRRLRLLRELHERGTIAAVADALQFTPSAVSQQLAMLEREAGVKLLERAGRGVRLTDAALVLVRHAGALLERAAVAEAYLAAAAESLTGHGRFAGCQSVPPRLALPAVPELARTVASRPLHLLDAGIGDEWSHQPWRLPAGLQPHELFEDPVNVVLSAEHPAARRDAVPLAELAGEAWTTGHAGMSWEEMTQRTCRSLGGFDPD